MDVVNVQLIVTLVILAIAAWWINTSTPEPSRGVRKIANVAAALIIVGVLLWLVNTYIPMAASIRAILNLVVVIATCVMVLQVFGVWDEIVKMWTGFVHRTPRQDQLR